MQVHNEHIDQLERKYRPAMDKRIAAKPAPVGILMERTFATAIWCLELLFDMPFQKLTAGAYFFCKEVSFRDIVRLYEAQLELAGAAPDKFVFGLHGFYNDIAAKIKKSNRYRELAEFLGEAMRLREEKMGTIDQNIIDAYANLILQTLEYIRPQKLDLATCVVGIDTDGNRICAPQPFPFVDMPKQQLFKMAAEGRIRSDAEIYHRMVLLYKEQGLTVRNVDDLLNLENSTRIQENTYTILLPFINEYTFDILPEIQYDAGVPPLLGLHVSADTHELKTALKKRKRTLPSNGVKIELDDPIGELQGVLLKEIFHGDAVHLLYRLRTVAGDLSGYYNTASGYFFSVTRETTITSICEETAALILHLYATQVLNDYPLENGDAISQHGCTVSATAYGMGGKLKPVYCRDERTRVNLHRDESYTHEDRAINGFIRRMPDGWVASEDAKRTAEELGYDLALNETYVRPFIRQTFLRKRPDTDIT